MKVYLLLFNCVSAIGWAYVLFCGVTCAIENKSAHEAWQLFGNTLCIVQALAGLEVLHSALKLVPSPIATTFLQVCSRYVALFGYSYAFPQAQNHWSFYLMSISWATTEVPRYLFYAINLIGSDYVPYPLLWLRYSLFAVLYPSGITGEIMQILQCLPILLQRGQIAGWYGTLALLTMYIPGSPTMISHMFSQRTKQLKALANKGKPPPVSKGIDFPLDAKTNTRSTTVVNQGAFVASIKDIDPQASEAVAREKNWRFGYAKHIVKNVELCCRSNEQCIKIAETGIDYLHKNFVYVQEGGNSMSVAEAMERLGGEGFVDTFTVEGQGGERHARDGGDFTVPYQKFRSKKVNKLTGDNLIKQLDVWRQKGVIEQDTCDAIGRMVSRPQYHGDDLKDKYFVLLGALSAMGPLRVLLELGCNVIAIDIDRESVWNQLIKSAREAPTGAQLIFPIKKKANEIKDDVDLAKNAGADLTTHAPHIANWIIQQAPGKQLVIGGYAYLDAALFVRLAIAMDAISAKVCAARKNTALAFLCSPTDVFVTDKNVFDARNEQRHKVPFWQTVLKMLTPKNMLCSNVQVPVKGTGDEEFHVIDGLSVAQGPNYALAKRLQHWRCMVARENGHVVSTNIAPSTATQSVVHNPRFAAACIGMGQFAPMEFVYQDLSNSIMTALLLNDLCDPNSAANPNTKLSNQIRLFSKTSAHFGIWNMAFKFGSIGEISAMIGYAVSYQKQLLLTCAAAMTGVAYMSQKGAPHKWMM